MDKLASGRWKYIVGFVVVVIIALTVVTMSRDGTTDNTADNMLEGTDSTPAPADMADTDKSTTTEGDGSALGTPNPLGEIALGSDDAPITIVEYSSLTCPHCAAFHIETLPQLKKTYIETGAVQIKFRPFPFDPFATAGAMLAQCVAPKQRVTFLDLLFTRQSQWINSQNPMQDLQGLARQAGLSEGDFVVCLKDETLLEGIRTMQKAAAEELGVRSTPTFFINGEKLPGNQPFENFEKIIKPLLPARFQETEE